MSSLKSLSEDVSYQLEMRTPNPTLRCQTILSNMDLNPGSYASKDVSYLSTRIMRSGKLALNLLFLKTHYSS